MMKKFSYSTKKQSILNAIYVIRNYTQDQAWLFIVCSSRTVYDDFAGRTTLQSFPLEVPEASVITSLSSLGEEQ
jgi:hypothetical protein